MFASREDAYRLGLTEDEQRWLGFGEKEKARRNEILKTNPYATEKELTEGA